MLYILPDTNVLIEDPHVIERLIKRHYYVVIPVTVIDELDNFKLNKDLNFKVRQIGILIENIINQRSKYLILTNNLKEEPSLKFKKADDRILGAALFLKDNGNSVVVLTNDRFMRLKAKGLGIQVVSLSENIDLYTSNSKAEIVNEKKDNLKYDSSVEQRNERTSTTKQYENRFNKNDSFLSFQQKREIFKSFKELTEEVMSNERVNYYFYGSTQKRKVIARELTHTGNGYIYGGYLEEYKNIVDDRDWINIKDYSEEHLRELIAKVINSMS